MFLSFFLFVSISEEFFRLKKVQGKKKRKVEIAENEKRLAIQRGENVEETTIGGGADGGGDILGGKDEDVIF